MANTRAYNDSTVLLSGAPVFLGVIDATTTSKTNAQATTAFGANEPYLTGKTLLIQPSAEIYLGVSRTSSGTVTTSNGVKVLADERVVICMDSAYAYLAAITASGTANVRVWELV